MVQVLEESQSYQDGTLILSLSLSGECTHSRRTIIHLSMADNDINILGASSSITHSRNSAFLSQVKRGKKNEGHEGESDQ